MKTTDHSFKIEDAKKYGVECAVLLYNLRHWLEKNVANEKHIHDGRVWTYNSTKAFADLFPYLSEKQIYRRLQKLEKEGILLTGNYNNHEYDRTKWYSIDETEYCISHNRENHSPKSENGNSESGETIPDINTDINTNNYVQFVDLWNDVNDCNLRITDKKREQIRARLRTYSEDELKTSIRNRSEDDWINGEGKKYKTNWDSFWRNDEKPERYLTQNENGQYKVIDGGTW